MVFVLGAVVALQAPIFAQSSDGSRSALGADSSPSLAATQVLQGQLELWFSLAAHPDHRYQSLLRIHEIIWSAESSDEYKRLLWVLGDRLDRLDGASRESGLVLLESLQNTYIADNIDALTRLFSSDASLRTQARVAALLGAFAGFVTFRNQLPAWMVENLQSRETYVKYLIGRLALTATVLDVSKPIRGERAIGRLSPVEVLRPRLSWMERYGLAPRTTIDHQEEVGTTTVVSTLLLTTAADALLSKAHLIARGTQISSPVAFVGSFVVADWVTKAVQPRIDEFYFSRAKDRLEQAVLAWGSARNSIERLQAEGQINRRAAEIFGLASEPLWQELAAQTQRISRFTACHHITAVPGPGVTMANSITPPLIDPQVQRARALASWPFRLTRLQSELRRGVDEAVERHLPRLRSTRDLLVSLRARLSGRVQDSAIRKFDLWIAALGGLQDAESRSKDSLTDLTALDALAQRLKVDRNTSAYLSLSRQFNCPSRNEAIEFDLSAN
jgi:hypothetical protein